MQSSPSRRCGSLAAHTLLICRVLGHTHCAAATSPCTAVGDVQDDDEEEPVEIEYVSAPLEFDFLVDSGAATGGGDTEMPEASGLGLGSAVPAAGGEGGQQQPSAAEDFQRILQRFGTVEELLGTAPPPAEDGKAGDGTAGEAGGEEAPAAAGEDGGEGDSEGDGEGEEGLSRKKRRLASRLKISELKQACERPDVVEIWDVTAQDPKLLVYLKVRLRWRHFNGLED